MSISYKLTMDLWKPVKTPTPPPADISWDGPGEMAEIVLQQSANTTPPPPSADVSWDEPWEVVPPQPTDTTLPPIPADIS